MATRIRDWGKKKSRFPVAPPEQRTLDGILFASKGEMMRYAKLRQMQRAGMITNIELQPRYDIPINGEHFCTYTADFRYTVVASGEVVVEDFKSSGTRQDAAYKQRKKAAQLHHGIVVTEVT
jgi:hypothetical protein